MTSASENPCYDVQEVVISRGKVLVMGTGACFQSLVSLLPDSVTILSKGEGAGDWKGIVPSFDFILYVDEEGNIEKLRDLHFLCMKARKVLLPAVIVGRTGLVGPLVHPDSKACWESAWRRIHRCSLTEHLSIDSVSSAAKSMLANVMASEVARIGKTGRPECLSRFFMLDLDTLEGDYHAFLPHPLAVGQVQDPAERTFRPLDPRTQHSVPTDENQWLAFFDRLTSNTAGIFHAFGEGELPQLPLAQCRVQAADPLSRGPAELLPEIIRAGLTHMEARRKAGLAGLESYAARLAGLPVSTSKEFLAAGAGSTLAEGVCRALQKCLTEELGMNIKNRKPSVSRISLIAMEDKHCAYYLHALTAIREAPAICLGEAISGFPVIWVCACGCWYGSTGLNTTLALRNALEQVLMDKQNERAVPNGSAWPVSDIQIQPDEPRSLSMPSSTDIPSKELLQAALEVLERQGKQLQIFDLDIEPGIKAEINGLIGILIREKESL